MNRAVGALYEPGSVFKIVTLSAAIDQGITTPDEVVDCQMGAIYIAGHRIRDHQAYGLLTVSQILAHSSDVGAIKIGLRLGAPKFYEYIRAYGFGSSDRNRSSRGKSRAAAARRELDSGVGGLDFHGPGSGRHAVADDQCGVGNCQRRAALPSPRGAGAAQGSGVRAGATAPELDASFAKLRRQAMRAMLEGVVLQGTGTKAQLDGYTSAGKTGTAQKIDPATGRYSATQLIASFVGFAPVNNPAVTILVQLDSPVGLHEGGSVAAPVFKRIADQVLAYRNVPHDIPVAPTTFRAARRSQALQASDVSDFDPAQFSATGFGDPQPDAARAVVVPASFSAPTVELAEGAGISVPDLAGKTVRQVTEICVQLGVKPVLIGTGTVQRQSPEPGAVVRHGASLTFQFGRPILTQAQLRRASR